MRFLALVIVSLLGLSLASPARADALADALYAYDHGAGPKAVALLTPLAEAGVVRAQEALLHIYAYGEGVPQDLVATLKWSRRAAALGSAIGENSVGVSYARGEAGLKVDAREALVWAKKAAAQGNTKAYFIISQFYFQGVAVERDPVQAMKYLQLAADGGYERAQMGIAALLARGTSDRPPDTGKALHYFELAAEQGNQGAAVALGGKLLDADDKFENIPEGVQWLLLAARADCVVATIGLSEIRPNLRPEDIASGTELADEWQKAHPPRDPHIHAEDRTDGCPAASILGPQTLV